MRRIRVLVAEDSIVVRRLLSSVIESDKGLELVGTAANGRIALEKVEQLKPDVLTLDIEMPEMDGLQALAELRKTHRRLPVIMFSTLTERGAAATLEALSLGASDYVTKPANVGSVDAAMMRVRDDLIPRIKALCTAVAPAPASAAVPTAAPPQPPTQPLRPEPPHRRAPVDLIAIGSSTGGPVALATVLGALPANLPVPVVVTQHMPPVFTRMLAERLDSSLDLRIREATDGDILEPGLVLIAPGDRHLTIHNGPRPRVRLNDGPPVNYCRPAVDVMFGSVATVYRAGVLAAVLTGMGHDGRDGAALIRRAGGHIIAQDEATSVVWGMPRAVCEAGLAHEILALDAIGPALAAAASSSPRRAVTVP